MFTIVNNNCYKVLNIAGVFDLKSKNLFKYAPAN